MEELDPTFKKSWKLLPMLIFLIAVVVIFFFSISKLVKNSTQTETRAAGAEVIETTGIIYKMPKCLNSFLCFYLLSDNNNSFLLSNKKYSSSLGSQKTISYTVLSLETYQNKKVSLKGFLVSGQNRYVIITEIKEVR